MIDYEKLTTNHRVQDAMLEWYDVVHIGEERDPHRTGHHPRRLVTFRRESDGDCKTINRESWLVSNIADVTLSVETKPAPKPAVGTITFKKKAKADD